MRLNEQIIIAKSKASGLDAVVNLNCAGMGLIDISILQQLENLETLSLSANNIASLEPLQHCPKLQSVYLRKNQITDVTELSHLGKLTLLTTLALSENPLSESLGADYRATVLSKLPYLKKLDDKDVTDQELEEAVFGKRGNTSKICLMDSNVSEASQASSTTSQHRNNLCEPQPCAAPVPAPCSSVSVVPPNRPRDEEQHKNAPEVSQQPPLKPINQVGKGTGSPKSSDRCNTGCDDVGGAQPQATNSDSPHNRDPGQIRLLTAAKCIINNLDLKRLEEVAAIARAHINKIRRTT